MFPGPADGRISGMDGQGVTGPNKIDGNGIMPVSKLFNLIKRIE
jgi:hypothetical protein